jgi:hypothetical protein
VGNLDSPSRVAVDRRGLVAVHPGAWSLDWWVRAESGWLFAAHESGVRQRLVDGAPVVETVLRAAGGDVVHRVYGARDGTDDHIAVEIENQTSVPIAVALAIRPYDLIGGGRVDHISIDQRVITVNRSPAIHLPRPAGQVLFGANGADAARALTSDDSEGSQTEITCEMGQANVALVMPLVHGSTLRVAVLGDGSEAADPGLVDRLPAAVNVAGGWRQVTERTARIVLPAGRLSDAFEAARRSLLIHLHGSEVAAVAPGRSGPPGDNDSVLRALTQLGHHGEVRQVLVARAQMQDPRGKVRGYGDDDVTASTLVMAADHLEHCADSDLAVALGDLAADGARWLLAQKPVDGFTVAALGAAGQILRLGGHGEAAGEIDALVPDELHEISEAELLAQLGCGLEIEALDLSRLIDRLTVDGEARFHRDWSPSGFDTVTTARLASRLPTDDQSEVLEWLLDQASPTWTWPTLVHPRLGTGTGGVGQDGRTAAAFISLVLGLLVVDHPADHRIELARYWFPAWQGHGVEVHDLPTRSGRVSWAIRWHGNRPALLWEVSGDTDSDPPVISAPGLDPDWVGSGWAGEALLGPRPEIGAGPTSFS